jgi:hypothetical protein
VWNVAVQKDIHVVVVKKELMSLLMGIYHRPYCFVVMAGLVCVERMTLVVTVRGTGFGRMLGGDDFVTESVKEHDMRDQVVVRKQHLIVVAVARDIVDDRRSLVLVDLAHAAKRSMVEHSEGQAAVKEHMASLACASKSAVMFEDNLYYLQLYRFVMPRDKVSIVAAH